MNSCVVHTIVKHCRPKPQAMMNKLHSKIIMDCSFKIVSGTELNLFKRQAFAVFKHGFHKCEENVKS